MALIDKLMHAASLLVHNDPGALNQVRNIIDDAVDDIDDLIENEEREEGDGDE
jgi:hypothetical protein